MTGGGRDPNAMDVDCLTFAEMRDYRQKRLCFNCKKTGHISKNCPNRKGVKQGNATGQKKTPRQIALWLAEQILEDAPGMYNKVLTEMAGLEIETTAKITEVNEDF